MRKWTANLALILATCVALPATAQQEDPGAYMTAANNGKEKMNKTYMAYVSAAAHGRRARKLEKMRSQVLNEINETRTKIIDLPYYKGDNSLRQSNLDYLKVLYAVFNDDYGKLVNVEEIAEQSIDEMQAYLLLQEKTNERLHEAQETLQTAVRGFAAKHHVQLTEEKSDLGLKMEKAGRVSHYHNDVFIVFFKCNWQDGKLVEAMNKEKVNEVEQARTALLRYANEGLAVLDTMKNFEGDASLKTALRQTLTTYKTMAEKHYTKMADFYLAKEQFAKSKATMDAKGDGRTKQDVDAYNAAVKNINQATDSYNQNNQQLNSLRSQANNLYEKASAAFMDQHTPHYK